MRRFRGLVKQWLAGERLAFEKLPFDEDAALYADIFRVEGGGFVAGAIAACLEDGIGAAPDWPAAREWYALVKEELQSECDLDWDALANDMCDLARKGMGRCQQEISGEY